jgi:DNA repair exonuclease SbcCD nuclease subunit
VAKDYDYWALGHIHKREILHRDPWVVFCGNLQGRHIRETGAKGCSLVTVDNGRVKVVEHRDLDAVRWAECNVAASGAEDGDVIVDRFAATLAEQIAQATDRPLAVRVRIFGSSNAHAVMVSDPEKWQNEIRARATDASGGTVWIERVEIRTSPIDDLRRMATRDDALGRLLRSCGHPALDHPALASNKRPSGTRYARNSVEGRT